MNLSSPLYEAEARVMVIDRVLREQTKTKLVNVSARVEDLMRKIRDANIGQALPADTYFGGDNSAHQPRLLDQSNKGEDQNIQ